MTDPMRGRRHARGLLTTLTAAVTAIAVIAVTTVVWFWTAGSAAADDGTTESLRSSGAAGSWHAADAAEFSGERQLSADAAAVLDRPASAAVSWIVQVQTTAAAAAEIRAYASGSERPAAPTLVVAPGTSSTSVMVRLGAEGGLALEATADAAVSVSAVAFFDAAPGSDAPGSDAPDPGGSVAIPAYTIVDSATSQGGPVFDGTPIPISVPGLGGIPSTGVQAAWLQISVTGAELELAAQDGPGTPIAGGVTPNALILAPLDEDGVVRLVPRGDAASLHVSVVGWVAAQEPEVAEATIEGGVVPVPAVSTPAVAQSGAVVADLPDAYAEADAVALFSATVIGAGELSPAGGSDGLSTTVPVAGETSAIVVAPIADGISVPPDAAVQNLTFLGVFPVSSGGNDSVRIEITAPADDSIDLQDVGGTFTISGVVSGTVMVRSIHVMLADRYIGAAQVRAGPDGLSWSLDTSAPGGRHTVTANVLAWDGSKASAQVTFTVSEPEASVPVGSNQVVVLTDADLGSLTEVGESVLAFASEPPAAVGEIVVAASSPGTPEGLLRRVTAVERFVGGSALRTEPATFTDAILQADVRGADLPLTDPAAETATAAPAGTRLLDVASAASTRLTDTRLDTRFTLSYQQTVDQATKRTSYKTNIEVVTASGRSEAYVPEKLPDFDGSADEAMKLETAYELGATVDVALRLTTTATLVLDIRMDWKWAVVPVPELVEFESSLTISRHQVVEYQLFGKVEKSFSAKPATKLGQVPLAEDAEVEVFVGRLVGVIPTPVPIPWTLSFWLQPEFELTLAAEAQWAYRVTESTIDTVGFRYVDGRLLPIAESVQTRVADPPTSAVELSAEIAGRLLFVAKFYEILGVLIGPEVSVEATATSTDGASFSSTGELTIRAVVGVQLEVMSKTLAEARTEFDLKSWKLWDTSDLPRASDDITLTPASDGSVSSGDGDRGLVVVFDLSGSMDGDKLVKAQESLRSIVDRQAVGAELGVWTYPSDSGCGAGSFAFPVQPVVGTAELMSSIGVLAADGQTPTGEALKAVADSLLAEGRTGATILLISDGESNCSMPPCEVASSLIAQGFDLHVESVGFQTSAEGAAELECIAQATGGSYTDVNEPDALVELLEELGRVELTVEVALSPTVSAGAAQRVEVTVTNPSSRDATEVRVQLTADGTLIPQFDSTPDIAIGNVPAGARVSRTITLSPQDAGAVGTTALRVTAWSSQSDLVAVDAEYATEISSSAAPGAVLGGDAGEIVSMGGSWTTAEDDVRDVASLFATVPSRVVVEADAARLGLVEFLGRCIADGCMVDSPATEAMFAAAQRLDLSTDYVAMWEAANSPGQRAARGGQTAPVIVTAFPDLFGDDAQLSCAGVDETIAHTGHLLIGMLNASTSASVEAAAAAGAEVYFVADTARALQSGHTLCDAESAIAIDAGGELSVDEIATQLLDDAVVRWSSGRERIEPTAAALRAAEVSASKATGVMGTLQSATDVAFSPSVQTRLGIDQRLSAKPGQTIVATASGFAPGTPVSITLDSGATILATAFADDAGSISTTIMIPAAHRTGSTVLTASGQSETGEAMALTSHVGVGDRVPVWVGGLSLAAVLLLAAGVVVFITAIVRGRRRSSPTTAYDEKERP